MSNLTASLERMAWHEDTFMRSIMILAELDYRDPHREWSNRPLASLVRILLPWSPRTTASFKLQLGAINSMVRDMPEVAWRLLINMMPGVTTISVERRKPEWRKISENDGNLGVTQKEYWDRVTAFSEIAFELAKGDADQLAEYIQYVPKLRPEALSRLNEFIRSEKDFVFPDKGREKIWRELEDIASKHVKYADADWALGASEVAVFEELAEFIAPGDPRDKNLRLFDRKSRHHYLRKKGWGEIQEELKTRRNVAAQEILNQYGQEGILAYCHDVEDSSSLGAAYGRIAKQDDDKFMLPFFLSSQDSTESAFVTGFVYSRWLTEC